MRAAKGPVAVPESSILIAVYAVVTAVLVLTGGLSETESLSDEDVSGLEEELGVALRAVEVNVEDIPVPVVEVPSTEPAL